MTIKEIRQQYGLTQKRFSVITGIPKRTIESWEGEQRQPAPYMTSLITAKLEKELNMNEKKQGN